MCEHESLTTRFLGIGYAKEVWAIWNHTDLQPIVEREATGSVWEAPPETADGKWTPVHKPIPRRRRYGMSPTSLGAVAVPLKDMPLVDVSPLSGDGAEDRQSLVNQVEEFARETGFFYVYHHGISDQLLDRVWAEVGRFFRLPEPQKMALYVEHNEAKRGYRPARHPRSASCAAAGRESFNVGLEVPENDPDRRRGAWLYGPNIWPVILPAFRSLLYDKYYQRALALARSLTEVFAQALDLPADYFRDKTSKPLGSLRVFHYPARNGSAAFNNVRCDGHTDPEMFTLLAQDGAGGLQIQRRDGVWIEAPYIQGTLVVTVGDLLARWSNDRFRAAPHRVVNAGRRERFSLPLAFGPDYFCQVGCLPTCRIADEEPRYPPVVAGEFVAARYGHERPTRRRILAAE